VAQQSSFPIDFQAAGAHQAGLKCFHVIRLLPLQTSKAAAEGEEQPDTKALLSVPRNHDGFYRWVDAYPPVFSHLLVLAHVAQHGILRTSGDDTIRPPPLSVGLTLRLGCRARKLGLGGKVHCMLALQTGLTLPPSFRLHRPATGRAPKILKLDELTLRCVSHQGDCWTCSC
jgi:hypothetical protein